MNGTDKQFFWPYHSNLYTISFQKMYILYGVQFMTLKSSRGQLCPCWVFFWVFFFRFLRTAKVKFRVLIFPKFVRFLVWGAIKGEGFFRIVYVCRQGGEGGFLNCVRRQFSFWCTDLPDFFQDPAQFYFGERGQKSWKSDDVYYERSL